MATDSEVKAPRSTSKRVIRFLSAIYFEGGVDPLTGNNVRVVRSGSRGHEVELDASEENRLDDLGALLPKGAKSEDAQSEQDAILDLYRGQRGDTEAMARAVQRAGAQRVSADPSGGIVDVSGSGGSVAAPGGNVGNLADRIREEKLNADDTVALAGDDPAQAKRVLEAERLASGGSPRSGVESKLQKLIDG